MIDTARAHQIPPTQFQTTTFRNIDMRRHPLLRDAVHRGFMGLCDTVLTQR